MSTVKYRCLFERKTTSYALRMQQHNRYQLTSVEVFKKTESPIPTGILSEIKVVNS